MNSEEITCDGKHVKVVLNGETIVDGDIEKASTPNTIDTRAPRLKGTRASSAFAATGSC
jgi:hypothetical protein